MLPCYPIVYLDSASCEEQNKCVELPCCYGVIFWGLMMELLSLMVVMSGGLGFNLRVAPSLNICVPNLPQGVKVGVCQRWSEFGWRCRTRVGQKRLSWDHSED